MRGIFYVKSYLQNITAKYAGSCKKNACGKSEYARLKRQKKRTKKCRHETTAAQRGRAIQFRVCEHNAKIQQRMQVKKRRDNGTERVRMAKLFVFMHA